MFTFDEKNYEPLKQYLLEEYGKPDRLLQLLFEKLSTWNVLADTCSYVDFSKFNIVAQGYLRDVVHFRQDVVKVPKTVVYTICTKLPDVALRKWEAMLPTLPKDEHLTAMVCLLADETRVRRVRYLDSTGAQRRRSEKAPTAHCFAVGTGPPTNPNVVSHGSHDSGPEDPV